MSERRCGFCEERATGPLRPWKGREACDDCREDDAPDGYDGLDLGPPMPWNYFANLALAVAGGPHPATIP